MTPKRKQVLGFGGTADLGRGLDRADCLYRCSHIPVTWIWMENPLVTEVFMAKSKMLNIALGFADDLHVPTGKLSGHREFYTKWGSGAPRTLRLLVHKPHSLVCYIYHKHP